MQFNQRFPAAISLSPFKVAMLRGAHLNFCRTSKADPLAHESPSFEKTASSPQPSPPLEERAGERRPFIREGSGFLVRSPVSQFGARLSRLQRVGCAMARCLGFGAWDFFGHRAQFHSIVSSVIEFCRASIASASSQGTEIWNLGFGISLD